MIENEKCDAGTAEGCLDDCSDYKDDYNCTGGSPTSSTICSKRNDLLKGEALVSSGLTISTYFSSLSTILLLVSSITQAGNLGPTYFILAQMQQIQKALTLIGTHENTFILEFLRIKMSMLDFVFIKDGLVKGINFNQGTEQEEAFYTGIKRAGFSHEVTFYLLIALLIQLVSLFILLGLISIVVMLFVKQFFSISLALKLKGVINGFIKFAFIAYPLRFLLENYLKIWGTFIIEINRISG